MSALGAGRLLFGPLLLTQSGRHADVPQRPMQSSSPYFMKSAIFGAVVCDRSVSLGWIFMPQGPIDD